MTTERQPVKGSFRDPSGSLFYADQKIYRQVNVSYKDDYALLISSGLYQALVEKNLLIAHSEAPRDKFKMGGSVDRVLEPKMISFISYPYEWSFSQFKEAALATLRIQKTAMDHGMCLKDASAFNIQFHKGSAVFIDTLSFRKYQEGEPWVAYRQFCQHFLAPLALMSKVDIRFNLLIRNFIDGIPLDLASKILPWGTRLNFGLLTHVHLHAKAQLKHSSSASSENKPLKKASVSQRGLIGIIDNLYSTIEKLSWSPAGTEWADYYDNTNYSSEAFTKKKSIIQNYLKTVEGPLEKVWDIGANDGEFSRAVSRYVQDVVSFDIDPAAVEINYRKLREHENKNILPLLLDLTNPTPSIGWSHEERESLSERGPANLILALALIHHLAISNNVPLERIAEFLHRNTQWLVIEFVPKSDSQVQILLATREDVFPKYDLDNFEKDFAKYFKIEEKTPIEGTERTLFLMKAKVL